VRPFAPLACAILTVVWTWKADAAPPGDDDRTIGPWLDMRDDAPHELWNDEGGGLWLAVTASAKRRDSGERALGGMVLVNVPLDRFSRPRSLPALPPAAIGQDAAAELKPPPRAPKPKPPAERDPPKIAPASVLSDLDSRPELAVVVTPDVARRAVRAALRAARLAAPDARIDALASRARASALLPELRLRATRLVDEAENVSPTEYDPSRTTASGGASLWLEARVTWRLDRLVFADEEVALERMRYDRAEAQNKLTSRVLEVLFAWQRAAALEADPSLAPDEHRRALLQLLEAEATLDVLTDGWFTRWREREP
jgi:hypothetical protein